MIVRLMGLNDSRVSLVTGFHFHFHANGRDRDAEVFVVQRVDRRETFVIRLLGFQFERRFIGSSQRGHRHHRFDGSFFLSGRIKNVDANHVVAVVVLPLGSVILGVKREHVTTERPVNVMHLVVMPLVITVIVPGMIMIVVMTVVVIMVVTLRLGLSGIRFCTSGKQAAAEQSKDECGTEL